MMDLRSLSRALGGEVSGRHVRAPAIGHSPQDRSLSICLEPNAPDGFLVHCFGSGNPLAEKDRIRALLGLRQQERGKALNRLPIPQPLSRVRDKHRTSSALAIWKEAESPFGTPVETYLTRPRDQGGRGIWLSAEAAGDTIRYHPRCPFAGQRVPAMVCLVRDVVTNEPKAIHRTALSPDGQKVVVNGHDRLSLGSIAGGAIKLTPDEEVTTCLGIGEGVESTLSLRSTPEFGSSPVWSLISSGGIGGLPVLAGIESLWIAVDHDPAGIEAAHTVSQRWRASGCETFLITPSAPRADLNDLLTGARHAQP